MWSTASSAFEGLATNAAAASVGVNPVNHAVGVPLVPVVVPLLPATGPGTLGPTRPTVRPPPGCVHAPAASSPTGQRAASVAASATSLEITCLHFLAAYGSTLPSLLVIRRNGVGAQ